MWWTGVARPPVTCAVPQALWRWSRRRHAASSRTWEHLQGTSSHHNRRVRIPGEGEGEARGRVNGLCSSWGSGYWVSFAFASSFLLYSSTVWFCMLILYFCTFIFVCVFWFVYFVCAFLFYYFLYNFFYLFICLCIFLVYLFVVIWADGCLKFLFILRIFMFLFCFIWGYWGLNCVALHCCFCCFFLLYSKRMERICFVLKT